MKKNRISRVCFTLICTVLVFTQFISYSCKQKENWQIKIVNESGKKIKKAYLYERTKDLETNLIDSLKVDSENISFNYINDLQVYKPYIVEFDNETIKPIFFLVKNKENLNIKILNNSDIVYNGTSISKDLNNYQKILKKEEEVIFSMINDYPLVDENDPEKLEASRQNISKLDNSLLEEKLNFISSIKDEDTQSYFVLYEILTQSVIDKNVFNQYYSALNKKSKNTYYGKIVNDIINHFNAYNLLKLSSFEDINFVEKEFSKLSLDDKQSKFGKEIESNIKTLKKEFDIFNFDSKQVNGEKFDFKDIKENLILVDFWASWCGPCREENKNLKNIYNKYKNSKFSLVSYSFDTDKKKWSEAITKDGIDWINISNLKSTKDDKISKALVIKALPSNIFIKNGSIIARNVNSTELDSFIKKNID